MCYGDSLIWKPIFSVSPFDFPIFIFSFADAKHIKAYAYIKHGLDQ